MLYVSFLDSFDALKKAGQLGIGCKLTVVDLLDFDWATRHGPVLEGLHFLLEDGNSGFQIAVTSVEVLKVAINLALKINLSTIDGLLVISSSRSQLSYSLLKVLDRLCYIVEVWYVVQLRVNTVNFETDSREVRVDLFEETFHLVVLEAVEAEDRIDVLGSFNFE